LEPFAGTRSAVPISVRGVTVFVLAARANRRN
jgi:hypothetical protein